MDFTLRQQTLESLRRESVQDTKNLSENDHSKDLIFDFNLYDIKIEQLLQKKSESVYMYISIEEIGSFSNQKPKKDEDGPTVSESTTFKKL
jgi:hypothetical protein